MYSIVNGYGVPKDILTDKSYHAYLGQVLNYLWDRYRSKKITIILCGGTTDMQKPYRRTEAGEMLRWFTPRLKALGLSGHWKLKVVTTGLNALDNLIGAKKIARKGSVLYFCEKTREKKSIVLLKRLFGSRANVVAIDFDTSRPRYDTETRASMEREDLRFCLRALEDPRWAKRLRAANRKKIEVLRNVPEKVRARAIDRITRELRKKFMERKVRL